MPQDESTGADDIESLRDRLSRLGVKKPLFAVTAVAMSTILSLILAEIVLRVIGFEFALYPTKFQFGSPDPLTLQSSFRVDRDLLWVPEDYASKLAAWEGKRPSVAFMGDSCTQWGRFDEYLEASIQRRDPDSSFSFVNVGVGGWSSYQGLQQLKRDVLPMRPRAVIIYYGWNDHWMSFGIEDKDIGQFNLEHPAILLKISRARVVQLVNRAILALEQSKAEGDGGTPARVSLADFTSNLEQIVQISQGSGITPILLTAPTSHQEGEEPAYLASRWLNDLSDLVPLHQAYVQSVRDVAARKGTPLIDLYAEVRRLPRREIAELFSKDGIHLTEEGGRKVAELLYQHMIEAGLYESLVGEETHAQ